MSGRISHIAVHPENKQTWYLGVASGGVWKTTNAGITFTPIFQNEGSYSIGAVVIDQPYPSTIWVGTGEANNQRSVGYGDGVYRSDDAGRTWRNVGLKTSEHIGRIVIDPRDSNVVFAAAYGPLWSAGGERGLYKTADGGANWTKVLEISENTGISDVAIDPSNPDVMLAVAHQRRRHTWTLIHGGPESGLHKSMDGGKTWRRIRTGLPGRRRRPHRHRVLSRRRRASSTRRSSRPASRWRSMRRWTAATAGSAAATCRRSRCTTRTSMPIRRIRIASTCRASRRRSPRTAAARSAARRAQQARRQPLHLDRSGRHRSPARRLRRRAVRELGSRPAVAALHQPLGHAVLQRRGGQRVADLQRLRRHAGQRHARRAVALADARRRHQQRLVRGHRRRRLRRAHRSERSEHRLRASRSTAASSGSIAGRASA